GPRRPECRVGRVRHSRPCVDRLGHCRAHDGVPVVVSEALLENLADTAVSVAAAILPLVALFVIFQLFLLRLPSSSVKEILLGTVLAAAGLFLFLLGISVGFLPFGRAIGMVIGSMREPWLIVPIGLFLG